MIEGIVADIQPFRAYRYDMAHVGNLSDVCAPPYDVIDSEMQQELLERHPANIVRVILNRPEPGDNEGAHYQRAAGFIRNWLRQGVMVQDPRAAAYVYHQEFQLDGQPVVRRGFISRIHLEKFGDGRIYPHEETHSKAKQDRLNLTRATQCNTSQIFSIYADENNQVQETLEAAIDDRTPLQATDDAGVVHKLWPVTDTAAIAEAATLMGPRALFIADGHHRYETALNYQDELDGAESLPADHPANYVSMCCVSMNDPGMIVLPTHRLWRGIPPISSSELCEKFAPAFSCQVIGTGGSKAAEIWERIMVDDRQAQMAFYCAEDDTWVMAELTDQGAAMMTERLPDKSASWRELGVSILHELAIPALLGLTDLPTPKYVRKIEEVVNGIASGDDAGRDATGQQGTGGRFELATIVMPATINHVRLISEAGERMPAKSTYFYPKLLSGLVLNPLTK
ncbi:MAG: DUF1015 domain-containing protein [Pirellulaceae bacterium]